MLTTRVGVQVDGGAHTQGMFKGCKLLCSMQQDLCFHLTVRQAAAKVVHVLCTDPGHVEQLQLLLGGGALPRPLAGAAPKVKGPGLPGSKHPAAHLPQ